MAKAERLGERLRHEVIDTPLEPIFAGARRAATWLTILEHPELETVYLSEPPAIQALLEKIVKNGMCCVDVGAHIGSFTAALRRLSPSGKHIAIEPTPYKAAWLRSKYPDVEVVECAVSAEEGRATFYYQASASGLSGLCSLKRDDESSFDVQIRRLDDIVPASRLIGFVKIDVEGAELDVFRGASRILERDKPTILFECTIDGLARYKQTPADMFGFLKSRGYRLYTPVDRLHNLAPLDESSFDRATRYPFRAFNFLALPSTK
jgi:FkbM family methyltransferase